MSYKRVFERRKHSPVDEEPYDNKFPNVIPFKPDEYSSCVSYFMMRVSAMIRKNDDDKDVANIMRGIAYELSDPFGGNCRKHKNGYDETVVRIGNTLSLIEHDATTSTLYIKNLEKYSEPSEKSE